MFKKVRFWAILLVMFILLPTSLAYEKIVEFDENEDIILTTTAYNATNQACLVCTCNLTLFNPHPNETIINLSVQLRNKGNGIYSVNITNQTNLTYSPQIYPFTLICNDSSGFVGADNREGIKVSETQFDFTSVILAVFGVGLALLFSSFKIGPEFDNIKKLCFFSSFTFFAGTLFLGYLILAQAPRNNALLTTMTGIVSAFLMVLLAILYLYIYERLRKPFDMMGNTRLPP